MTFGRKLGLSTASILTAAVILTGCGAGPSAGPKEDITWMAMLHTPMTPPADAGIEAELEELSGLDLTFEWIPAASASEKLNAAIAADSLADIVSLPNITDSATRRALTSGQFWDIEKYLSEFPNLSQIDPERIEGARIDGKLFGVPVQSTKARYGAIVRQDWLDNLGLEVPHTIEELSEVARAFTDDDPDGNGKDDTTGFYDRSESFLVGFRSLSGYFGAGSEFELTGDDDVVASFTSDAFKEAMEWYRGMYEDGAVNSDFVTVQKQNQKDGIAQGKGGIVITGLFDAKNYASLAESADPDSPMTWTLINDLTYEDVPRRILTDTNGGVSGWFAIPKSEVESEADLRVVLGFMDTLLTEDAFSLMTNGIEDVHFEFDEDGAVETIDMPLWEQEVQPHSSSRMSDSVVRYPNANEYVDEANALMDENAEYVVTNVAQSLTSPTYDTRWTQVQQSAQDAYNKYIVGQLEMSDYEEIVDDLLAGDLGKIQDEYTAAYADVHG